MADTEKKVLIDVDVNVKKAESNLAKVTKAQQDYANAISEEGKTLRQVKKEKTDAVKMLKLQEKLANSAKGSYDALSAQYSINRIAINKLSAEQIKNDKSAQKLIADTKELRKGMDESQKATGNASISVGGYTKSLEEAGLANTKFGMAKGIFMKVKAAGKVMFGSIKAGVMSTGIGALLIAFGSLMNWFKKTEKGAGALRRIMAVLGAVTGKLSDIFVNIGETIYNAFTNPKKAITDLWKVIKTNLIARFDGVLLYFKSAGETLYNGFKVTWLKLKSMFSDEAKAELEKAKLALIESAKNTADGLSMIATGFKVDELKKGIKGVVGEVKDLVTETGKAVTAADKLAARDNQWRKDKRKFIVDEAKARSEIAKLEEIAANKNLSKEERAAALAKAIKIQKEIETERVRLAREAYNIKKEENTLSASSEADLDKEAELKADIYKTQENSSRVMKKLIGQQTSLTEATQATKDVNDDSEALADELEDEEDDEEEDDKEIEKLAAKSKKIGDDKLKQQKKDTDNKLKNDEKQAKAERKAGEASVKFGKKMFSEKTAAGKAFRIAEAGMDTYKAASGAYASLAAIPVVGPALGIAAAAAATVAGLANVAKIKGTDVSGFETGGIVGGNSFTGDNIPVNVNSSEMILTQQQQATLFKQANGATPTGNAIDYEALGEVLASKINNRVVVVEDVTDLQSEISVRESNY